MKVQKNIQLAGLFFLGFDTYSVGPKVSPLELQVSFVARLTGLQGSTLCLVQQGRERNDTDDQIALFKPCLQGCFSTLLCAALNRTGAASIEPAPCRSHKGLGPC